MRLRIDRDVARYLVSALKKGRRIEAALRLEAPSLVTAGDDLEFAEGLATGLISAVGGREYSGGCAGRGVTLPRPASRAHARESVCVREGHLAPGPGRGGWRPLATTQKGNI